MIDEVPMILTSEPEARLWQLATQVGECSRMVNFSCPRVSMNLSCSVKYCNLRSAS